MNLSIDGPAPGDPTTWEKILRTVPEWFGIDSAIQEYLLTVPALPTFQAVDSGETVGLLTLRCHFPETAEIYLIAVNREWHRRKVGVRLIDRAEEWLRSQGAKFLQVKTLGESHDNLEYAGTRRFYEHVGFSRLEEFPDLWSDDIPCLIMVKSLQYEDA